MSSRKVNHWSEWEWSDPDGCWIKFGYDKHGKVVANEHQIENVPRGTSDDVGDLTAGFSNVNITEPYSDPANPYHDSAYTHSAQNKAAPGGHSHEYAHASAAKSSSKSKSRSKGGGSGGTNRPAPLIKSKSSKKPKEPYPSNQDQNDPFYTYPPSEYPTPDYPASNYPRPNYPPSQREAEYPHSPPDDVNDIQGKIPTGREDPFQLDPSEQAVHGSAGLYYDSQHPTEVQEDPYAHGSRKHKGKGATTEYYEEDPPEPQDDPYAHGSRKHKGKGATAEYYEEDPPEPQDDPYAHGSRKHKGKGATAEYYEEDPPEPQDDPYAHGSRKHKGKGATTEYYEEDPPEPQDDPYAHGSRKHKGKGATTEYYEEDPSGPQENTYLHGSKKNKGKGVEYSTAPGVRFDIPQPVLEGEDEEDDDEDGEMRAVLEASRHLYNSGGRQSESSAQVENDYEDDAYEYEEERPMEANTGSGINMKHDAMQPGYDMDYYEEEQQDVYSKRSNFIQGDPSTGTEEQLDPRFVIQPSNRFQPGEVFKVLWSEPHGGKNDRMTDNEIRTLYGERFYICFRRFVVVANDEGHCTCVPILTYERRGCNKKGVKPAKHGIVHALGSKPRPEPGEPTLGFKPVRLDLVQGEKLAPQSRINYSKLVTIEHNVKVFFIGSILAADFEKTVSPAVDQCWSAKNSGRRKGHRK